MQQLQAAVEAQQLELAQYAGNDPERYDCISEWRLPTIDLRHWGHAAPAEVWRCDLPAGMLMRFVAVRAVRAMLSLPIWKPNAVDAVLPWCAQATAAYLAQSSRTLAYLV